MKRARLCFAALLVAGCAGRGDTVEVSGTVEIRDIQLAPLTWGRLERLLKDEGDSVHAGDTVAILTQPGLNAVIGQRQAQARAATLRVAEVTAAQADSERAANDLARGERLLKQNIVSPQQYDGLRTAAAAAAARLAAVRAAPSDAAAAREAVDAASSARDELTLVAPADGLVLVRYADQGEVLASGSPVVSIGLVRQPWVRAYVGERDIGRVKVGQPANLRVDAYPGQSFPGHITEIASRAEFTPRVALTERERADLVFGIKIEPNDGDGGGRLKAGMPVTIELRLMP
ncbi:MAG TPA: efflux RND transporter periplasmic adaptor subunit [Gemmatimonadales bacterium]|nr:efflux RND transporter periplasmic adaptor subunit [Gemmatimonadales bacterium]